MRGNRLKRNNGGMEHSYKLIYEQTGFRRKFFLLTLLGCLLIPPGQLFAEPLTLEAARRMALENSLVLKNAELYVETQEINGKQLAGNLLPSISANLSAGAGYALSTAAGNERTTSFSPSLGISVQQPVYRGGTWKLEKESSAVSVGIARADKDTAYLEVLTTADSLYIGYLQALSTREASSKELEAVEVLLDLTMTKLENGAATRSDFLGVQADAAAKRVQLHQADGEVSIAEAKLASFLSLESTAELQEAADVDSSRYDTLINELAEMEDDNITVHAETLIARGLSLSPEIITAALTMRQSKLEADLTRKEYAPTISIGLSDSISSNANLDLSNSGSISLSGSLTLSQWNRKGTNKKADIAITRAENSHEETVRNYILEIRSAWFDLISAARNAESSMAARDYARELYQLTLEKYRLSAAPYSDLADAEAQLSTNNQTYIAARYTFLQNMSALASILGLERWEDLWEIISI